MDETKNLFAAQMAEKGLDVEVKCDLADANVLCDANRLSRVLLNLISNAYKFTPAGGRVAVSLSQTGRDEKGASYTLSVKDTGIGMSPEFAAKVFEAYERERTDTVESIQGTGLGTAITKSIVDLMGGTIDVETEQGKGTEFIIRVSFPIDPDAAVASDAFAADAAAGNAFRGMRVLLVEDNDANREMEKVLFENIGFTVDAVENGMDAVEAIASSVPGEYSAVLMDIEMPVRNGIEATKTIRSLKNPALAGIPIIAVSARAFSEDIAAVRDAGMNGHIAKPIDMNQVVKTLSEILLQR
jgi:CheY-like chemotaxis protein